MLTRRVRIQIAAFIAIALVGISYAGARYAGLGRLFGPQGYVVTMNLAEAGGIFDNAEVTYLGVPVGRVGTVRLTPTGVAVPLDINASAPPIPSNVEAAVTDRSAVGEQYVDLRPKDNHGPYLQGGSVISEQSTQTPLPVQSFLTNLDSLVNSVPQQSMRTVVGELGTAFQGNGQNLQTILDTARQFTAQAQQNLPQTQRLLADANTVLTTQNQQGSDIRSFSQSLLELSGQLRKSNGDLNSVLTEAAPAGAQVSDLLRETGPQLGVLLGNLTTTAQLLSTKENGIQLVLVMYPGVLNTTYTVVPASGVPSSGTVRFGAVLNEFNPVPCTNGYQGTTKRPGTDMAPVPLNADAHCAEPPGSPTDVRGGENAPSN
jgi:phospholipid/cholesterol/gamma-HCH transport system substrate-binding protein